MEPTFGVLRSTNALNPVAPLLAIVRGLVQLAILSVILTGVITNSVRVGVALLVMFGVAVTVASGRIGRPRRLVPVAAVMGNGVVVTILIVFVSGDLQLDARYALAIGNTMLIAAIGGRRLVEGANDHWAIKGWFELSATPRQAGSHRSRPAGSRSSCWPRSCAPAR